MVSLHSLASSLAFAALAKSALVQAFQPAATIGRDQAVSYSVNATARQPWQQTISVPGTKYLTVHFSQFQLADGDLVTLSDPTGTVTAEYAGLGRGDLGDKGGFYSTQVFSSSVTVQYKPSPITPTSGNYGFAIDKVVRSASAASVSSICGTSQLEPTKCYVNDKRVPAAYTKAQAVARLTITGGKSCTGWLVGTEGHLLTNFHCIASQFEASNTQYEFGAESPTCEDQCVTAGSCRGTIAATTATFVGGDQNLDYALVKLNTTADLSKYGFLTLRIAGGVDQEQIYIPQHPGGRAQNLAVVVDNGDVARATMGFSGTCGSYRVGYDADTEPGSSGSPVLATKDNAVIALHSCGSVNPQTCMNSGLDVRSLIFDLRAKNIVPVNAIDDPSAEIPNGPWIPTTPAPGPTTPAPTVDFCKGFVSVSTCTVFAAGRCLWVDGKCMRNPDFGATPAPTTVNPAPTAPTPTTPAPTTPTPTTPTPTTVEPPTPAPTIDICPGFTSQNTCEVFTQGICKWIDGKCTKNTSNSPTMIPSPTTSTPTTPTPPTPAPTTLAPTTPAPTTPAPTTPTPTTSTPTTSTPSKYDSFCKPFPNWFCFGLCKWDGSHGKCVGI